MEGHVRGAAWSWLLTAGRLTEHIVGVHSGDAQLLEALVYELVLAPRMMPQQGGALRQACDVCGHSPSGEHFDGSVQAPFAVVQVHSRGRGHFASKVVASATAVLRRLPCGDSKSLRASLALALPPSHVGGATLVGAVLQPAIAALELPGLRRARLDMIHGHAMLEERTESIGEKDCIGINFYRPIVEAVPAQADDFRPDPVEDPCVECGAPTATILHGEGTFHEGDVHRRRPLRVKDLRGIAEDRVLVAAKDAHSPVVLFLEETGLVTEGHHQGEAVERGLCVPLLVQPS
mmetsp:Transcript_101791/g.217976  ORF Transcript_101791/g.217976 Transcript_101791/m.217976 type:complete len:291 (-) Transcript_101791:1120-1992(-)